MKNSHHLLIIVQNNLGTLSIILTALALFFGIFLLTVKTKNKIGNVLLGLYFIIMAIDFSVYFFNNIPVWLKLFRNDFVSFVSRPLLYLYVLSVLYLDFKLTKKHLLHSLWLVIVVIIMWPWYFGTIDNQLLLYRDYLGFTTGKFIMGFSLFHTQIYLIAIFVILRRYKKVVLDNFSNPNLINYKWLLKMTIMLQGFFTLVLIKNLFRIYSNNETYIESARVILVAFTILFLIWLLLMALHVPQIFRGINSKLKSYGEINNSEEQNVLIEKQVQELEIHMSTKEPFLDSDLTIQVLANQLNITSRNLSILINYHFKQHFYDFINNYRITKAKELLAYTTTKQLTISEIFYKVGFNTKSSFNTAFKKQVGVTPSQYRKNRNI